MGETLVLVHGALVDRQIDVVEPGVGPDGTVVRSGADESAPVALVFRESARAVELPLGSSSVVGRSEGRLLFGEPNAFFPGSPDGAFVLQRRQDPPSAVWGTLSPVPSEIAALAVPFDGDRCPQFGQPLWLQTLDPYEDVEVVRLDETRAVVVALNVDSNSGKWVASAEGIQAAGSGQNVVALQVVDDEIWMADQFGALWRADPDPVQGWGERRPLVPALSRSIIGFTTSGTTSDIFVGTAAEDIRYYNGREWTIVGGGRVLDRQIVSSGPGEALFIDRGRLIRATEDGVRGVEEAPTPLTSVQNVEGLGTVVGTDRGAFFANVDGRWVDVVPSDTGFFSLSVAAFNQGLVFLLGSGVGGFFREDTGVCLDAFGLGFVIAGTVLPMGPDLLVVGEVGRGNLVDVLWVPGPN